MPHDSLLAQVRQAAETGRISSTAQKNIRAWLTEPRYGEYAAEVGFEGKGNEPKAGELQVGAEDRDPDKRPGHQVIDQGIALGASADGVELRFRGGEMRR